MWKWSCYNCWVMINSFEIWMPTNQYELSSSWSTKQNREIGTQVPDIYTKQGRWKLLDWTAADKRASELRQNGAEKTCFSVKIWSTWVKIIIRLSAQSTGAQLSLTYFFRDNYLYGTKNLLMMRYTFGGKWRASTLKRQIYSIAVCMIVYTTNT